MFVLALDVLSDLGDAGLAHGEFAVAVLPVKPGEGWPIVFSQADEPRLSWPTTSLREWVRDE